MIQFYIRVTIKRKHKDYSLGVSVPERGKYWDDVKKRVKRCSFVNMIEINNKIEDTLERKEGTRERLSINEANRLEAILSEGMATGY
ncbi:MAG: Arm DNA-binding domain-containing protein [Bacteroidota bacterium]